VIAQDNALDLVFHALSNPTRRLVFERLQRGPATVKSLAEPFDMALPSFLQHIRVLEDGGLVRSHKRGRVRTVKAVPTPIKSISAWLDRQRDIWNQRLDQLDSHLKSMEENDE
jgi:DNA-binding transcriptional ArsR family regulator